MGLSHEHKASKIPAKIQIYILPSAELLITLCYEIPCRGASMCRNKASMIWTQHINSNKYNPTTRFLLLLICRWKKNSLWHPKKWNVCWINLENFNSNIIRDQRHTWKLILHIKDSFLYLTAYWRELLLKKWFKRKVQIQKFWSNQSFLPWERVYRTRAIITRSW